VKKNNSSIHCALGRAGQRLKLSAVCLGLSWWLATCLGWWFLLFALDNFFCLPAGLRLPLAVGGSAFFAAAFMKRVIGAVKRKTRLEGVAVFIEKRSCISNNILVNAYEFESQPVSPEEEIFVQHAIAQGQAALPRIHLSRLIDSKKLFAWGSAALVLFLIWMPYVMMFPQYVRSAARRYARPLADLPPVGRVVLSVTPSSDIVVIEGESLEVHVVVDSLRGEETRGSGKPPVIVWREGTRLLEPSKTAGDHAEMVAATTHVETYTYTFNELRRSFAFRILAENTYTRNVGVKVCPRPRIREALFQVSLPAYAGGAFVSSPGPPASLSVLPDSAIEVSLKITPCVDSAVWREIRTREPFLVDGETLLATSHIVSAGPYEIWAKEPISGRDLAIASGEITLQTDLAPEVDFLTEDRNRFATQGNTIPLMLQAKDDFGVRRILVTSRKADQDPPGTVLKEWSYMGPPGPRNPGKETFELRIDPGIFVAGDIYRIEARAFDFRPGGKPGKSAPLILRIKSPAELSLAAGDPLARTFELLRSSIAEQRKANGLTADLNAYLGEALERDNVPAHRAAMSTQQEEVKLLGSRAVAELETVPAGKRYLGTLSRLIKGEMSWVLEDIGKINTFRPLRLPGWLSRIEKRQTHILRELIALAGTIAERQEEHTEAEVTAQQPHPYSAPADEQRQELRDSFKEFTRDQKRILARTRSLVDQVPEDLTEEEEKVLGELAREESKWADFFEEKLTDFSKLPLQDFADDSLAEEFNEVYQEIKLAAESLYAKKNELAVPHEQSGLASAEEFLHNLERWLPDVPDRIKWVMEEAEFPADIPLGELPAELEDIIGVLIDREEEMSDEVEDVSSAWIDSIDKGAGWDAMDGPISSMGAKGVTGNLLPNQHEIGGRSGEGRTGRSHGQMVEKTASGKGGRETPTRLTPGPFEDGSVADASRRDSGGATGGGKLSGFGVSGLRGPAPAQQDQEIPRLAGRQAEIRQAAEDLALKLRGYHLPTGDIEGSVASMKHVEDAITTRDGLALRQAFNRALDALGNAKTAVRRETGLQRERTSRLPAWMRDEIMMGLRDGMPRGYEDLIREYFRALAEKAGEIR